MTVEELNELMPTMYLSSELISVGWDSTSDSDKTVLIIKAEDFLSNLLYEKNFEDDEVFKKDKHKAICSIVYDLLETSSQGVGRLSLIRQGVKSISTAGVSESYGEYKDIEKNSEISDSYKKFLWRYLYRGV